MNSMKMKFRRRHVGLDIGTTAVRAVEIRGTHKIRSLTALAEVPLPEGAVVAGEITDPEQVGQALREMFKDAKFSTRSVRAGLSGKRMMVRQIEMPAMSDAELKKAVGYAAFEHIPFAPDDSVMDYQMTRTASGGCSVIVAAAEKHAVNALVDALTYAKLEPLSVELNAWASARASAPSLIGDSPAAVIDIGASTADVVITEGGMVKFLRVLESPPDQGNGRRGFGELDRFVSDVSDSISYYLQKSGSDSIDRFVLAGGRSAMKGLSERLEVALGVKVSPTDWPRRLPFSNLSEDPARARTFTVAVGLALGGIED